MAFSAEQLKSLQAKLSPDHVKTRAQAGRQLSYVEGWHAIAEANRIFGFDAWDRQLTAIRQLGDAREVDGKWRVSYMATVRITVSAGETEIVRDGTGYGSGIDKDVGQAHESALKEAETDAMKRALMTFGNPFGLALYDKAQENVGHEPADRTIIDTLLFAMKRAENRDDLKAWGAGQKAEIDALPEAQRNEMKAAYSAFLRTLPETLSEAA